MIQPPPVRAILMVALCLVSGCDSRERPRNAKPQLEDVALMWAPIDRIVFQRLGWWVSGDSRRLDCEDAGLYTVTVRGGQTALYTREPICESLAESQVVDLNASITQMAYVSPTEGDGLYILQMQSGEVARLATDCAPARAAPLWSLDERQLAFVGTCGSPASERTLHIVNADGSSSRAVEVGTEDQINGRVFPSSWSPDGSEILAVVLPASGAVEQTPTIIAVDLTHETTRSIAKGYSPGWSRSGNWIAYIAADSAGNPGSTIQVVAADGTQGRVIYAAGRASIPGGGMEEAVTGRLVWSPDDSRIAFSRKSGGGSRVWAVDVRNGSLVQMTRD
jgi:Tol biopolymer transport system component